jgi:hypothetical protein
MASVVYAVDTVNIMMPDGQMVLIRRDQPFAADDPVVAFKPQLFSEDSEFHLQRAPRSFGADGLPVDERATAVPGERRARVPRS